MTEAEVAKIAAQAVSGLGIRIDFSKRYGSNSDYIMVTARLLNYNGDVIAEDSSWIPVEEFR